MDNIPIKECYEPRFEAINQSQVALEGEHPWPERKGMQQGLQRRDWQEAKGIYERALSLDSYRGSPRLSHP